MVVTREWTEELYRRSVTAHAFWYTPYDAASWAESRKYGADPETDEELRQIVAMEAALGEVSPGARQVAMVSIRYLPCCGHADFPRAFLEAVSAIGAGEPRHFIHGCYTANRARKERMVDYLFCLDAWLAGAAAEDAARELALCGKAGIPWTAICTDLWYVLGERTEARQLLVERLLHRLRWWVKTLTWDDDARDLFGRDQYLGDIHGSVASYGNPDFADPFFTERESPQVAWLTARLEEVCPETWSALRDRIECTWLCAPKAFRYMERLLWAIGQGDDPGAEVPAFLHIEDTYPDHEQAAAWWDEFLAALRAWWGGKPLTGPVVDDVSIRLGPLTAEKGWLVRLLVRKLELYEQFAEIKRLVRPTAERARGLKPVL